MHPFLDIFGFTIPGYGMFAGMAVMVSYGLAWWGGGRSRLGKDDATTMFLLAGAGAGIGSRLLQVIVERDRFEGGLLKGMMRPEGGIWYGAVLGGIALVVIFSRTRKINPFLSLDVMAPSWAAGHAVGRIGCYLGGCCFGTPTTGSIGVSFPPNSAAYKDLAHHNAMYVSDTGTVPLVPVQLFEAGGEMLLAGVLLYLLLKKLGDGVVFLTYAGAYGAMRFVLEWWRFDPVRGWVIEGWISTSQLIAIGMLAAAIGFGMRLRRKAAAVV